MQYMCIDLKSFYASCECVMRGLNPFTTPLVVADPERGQGTIVMAVTPFLKQKGIPSRCRLFQIPKEIEYICAKPRMQKYIDYSVLVYKCFLDYFSSEDIHVYSIDESFINVEPYLKLYNKSMVEMGMFMLQYIKIKTGLTATCGCGDNMLLAKIALDLFAKHAKGNVAYLNQELFIEKVWDYQPLTDIWQIGRGTANHLGRLGLYSLRDVANASLELMTKEFGVNGKFLYDQSWGICNTTISEIKAYTPVSKQISTAQVFFSDYGYEDAQIVLLETLYNLHMQLLQKKLYCSHITLLIRYSKNFEGHFGVSKRLDKYTNSYAYLKNEFLNLYKRVDKAKPIRVLGLAFGELSLVKSNQLSLFDVEDNIKEEKLNMTIAEIKTKYGKSSVFQALSYLDRATMRTRSKLIGGHNRE